MLGVLESEKEMVDFLLSFLVGFGLGFTVTTVVMVLFNKWGKKW
jgi:hypothetical protein